MATIRDRGRDTKYNSGEGARSRQQVVEWRYRRLVKVGAGTPLRQLTVLRHVFEIARKDGGSLAVKPAFEGVEGAAERDDLGDMPGQDGGESWAQKTIGGPREEESGAPSEVDDARYASA